MEGGVSPLIGPGIATTNKKAPDCLSPTHCSSSFVEIPGKAVVFHGRSRGFQVVLCKSEGCTLLEGVAGSPSSSPSLRGDITLLHIVRGAACTCHAS